MPFNSARTRLIVLRTSFVAPSVDGKASTRLFGPLIQSGPGGATAPATPGVSRSLAAIASRLAPFSTSTTNGFITPAEMPASASAARPSIASPLPGKSFACASLGFSCTP